MSNKIKTAILCMSLAFIVTACGFPQKAQEEGEDTVQEDDDGPDMWMYEDIRASDAFSGVMQFGSFRFELGDKIFKFEDAGFECRENDYKTTVEPYSTKTIILYATAVDEETESESREYIYLKGYNPTDTELALRNCNICYAKDDKLNQYAHLGVSKGIIQGISREELVNRWGEPGTASLQNNDEVLEYSDDEKTYSMFVNRSTGLIEEISCQEQVDEQAAKDEYTEELK